MAPLGAPVAEALGPEPEKICRQFSDGLRRCLQWHDDEWLPLQEELNEAGLRFQQLLAEQPPEFSIGGELLRMADLLDGAAQKVLAARQDLIRRNALGRAFAEVQSLLEDAAVGGVQGVNGNLLKAMIALDPAA